MSIHNHPSTKGDVAELILATELVSRGLNISIPFGHNQLYDLVVEHGVSFKLLRVQVKMRSENYQKDSYRFQNLSRYVGNVDIMAFLCGDDWYFWTNLKLKRYGTTSNVILKTKHNLKNNWKVFGV